MLKRLNGVTHSVWAALAVFAFGASLTLAARHLLLENQQRQLRERMDNQVRLLDGELRQRFASVERGLHGARALYLANDLAVSRDRFARYMVARDLDAEFPGVRGFGYIERVKRSELPAFIARERRDEAPGFEVKTSGNANDLFVIKLIEPLERNRAAVGLDVGAESVRREGAERAVNSGQPALTASIRLVQDGPQRPGFLYFLPTYWPGMPLDTASERQLALHGLSYAPIVLQELLAPVRERLHALGLHFQLLEPARAQQAERVLYDLDDPSGQVQGLTRLRTGELARSQPLTVGGYTLDLQVSARPDLVSQGESWLTSALSALGWVLSLVAAYLTWLLMSAKVRAEALAGVMTQDLERLALIARRTSNAVVMTDPQLRIAWVNDGFTRMCGYTLDDARGKTPGELLGSGKADPATLATMARAAREAVTCRVEILNRAKDGREYWLDTEVQPMRNDAGELLGFIEIGLDVTQQKATQQQLRATLAQADELARELDRLSLVARRTSNAVIITDPQGRVTWVNEGFVRLTGYTLEQALGKKPGSFLQCPATNVESVQFLRQQIAAAQPCRVEILNCDRYGRQYWVDVEIQPLYDESGQHMGFMAVEQDITDRRIAYDSLSKALLENQQLTGAIRQAAIVSMADRDGIITEVSDRFEQISGYSRAELIGQNHRILKSGAQPPDLWPEVWATISGGKIWHGEVCNRRKDGSLYWVDSTIVPFLDQHGLVEKYISIRTDITDIKASQQQLKAQSARLDNILQGTHAGTWEWDISTGSVQINARLAEIIGYTLSELTPATAALRKRMIHPTDLLLSNARMAAHFSGEASYYECEVRMRHKRGHWVWVMDRGRVSSRSPSGMALEMSGTTMDVSDRKRAEQALRDSEAHFKALSELSAEWFWETDAQFRFTNFVCGNPVLLRQLQAFALGRRRWDTEGSPIVGSWQEHQAALEQRQVFRDFQYRSRDDQGQTRIWSVSGAPRFNEAGVFMGYIGTGADITERKRSERRLARSEAMLERTSEIAAVGAWRLDLRSRRVEWSAQTCRIHEVPVGYEPSLDEAINFYPPQARPIIREQIDRAIEHGLTWDLELPLVTAKGRQIWVRAMGEPEIIDGQPVGLAGAFQDVTERRLRDEQLRADEERLRAIYDILPVGISITDPDGHIVDCNAASERLLGITKAEHLARDYDSKSWTILNEDGELMPPEQYASVRALTERRPVLSVPMHVITPTGSVWLSVSAMPVAHERFGVVIVYMDISERRAHEVALSEAKTRAEQASLSKSQFLATMSHEIRTPMNAILGLLQLMHNTALDARQRDYVQKTEGAARSLLGLLNDILDFSKVEAGKMTLDPHPLRVEQLMRDLSVILSASVDDKPVELLFDLDPSLPAELVGDAMRIKQILINLCGNAIKFTSQGEVLLSLRRVGQEADAVRVRFAVRDTGIGIAPENQARIFSGFSQAEASTTRRFGGTGLGLAISQRLVSMMGGELKLESALGEGSNFWFEIDLAIPPGVQPSVPAIAPPPARPVLLADDHPEARKLLAAMAASIGWQVEVANSSAELLQKIEHSIQSGKGFEAYFVDWSLLDTATGERLHALQAAAVGAAPAVRSAPLILMVTAQQGEALAQRSAQHTARVDASLTKPATASMLAEALAQASHPVAPQGQGSGTHPAQAQPLAGLRILLVEDNPINQQVADELLRSRGAQVQIADNGQAGLDAIAQAQAQAHPFDVVLMDLQMPVMDGLSAVRQIRGPMQLPDLPVIAMTANAMAGDREISMAAGMNDHVGKPFELEHLVATLLHWSGRQTRDTQRLMSPLPQQAKPQALGGVQIEAPVLDRAGALQRMGGNQLLLDKLCISFAGDLLAQIEAWQRELAQGQQLEATRRMHTLKGTASTVGALRLSDVARAAEKACQERAAAADPTLWVQRLTSVAELTLAAFLDLGLAWGAAAPAQAAAADPVALRPRQRELLTQMLERLQASDLGALELMFELQDVDDPQAPDWSALDEALQAMDFENAAAICQALLRAP